MPGTVLPTAIKEKILTFGEYSMGAYLVDLILRDGRVVKRVMVAWGEEIIRVGDGGSIDFDVGDVVDALDRSEDVTEGESESAALSGSVVGRVVRCVGYEDIDGVRVLGLSEQGDGGGWHLLLQDQPASQEGVCVSDSRGASHYGGVASCVLEGAKLRLRFTDEAVEALDVLSEMELELQVSPQEITTLRDALVHLGLLD